MIENPLKKRADSWTPEEAQAELYKMEVEDRGQRIEDLQTVIAGHGFDTLTGVLTRKAFEREFDIELAYIRGEVGGRRASGERVHTQAALLFIDLDKFKAVNDKFGHLTGDEVLKHAARVFEGAVRPESDKVARYGGDEFNILLPDTDEVGAITVGNKILKAVEADAVLSQYEIGASIGVVTTAISTDRETLIKAADEAMYRAKEGGRNQVST